MTPKAQVHGNLSAETDQGKNGYALNYIRARRSDTSKSWISAIFFVMNGITLWEIYIREAHNMCLADR